MDTCFPGTVISRCDKSARSFLDGLFFATKGIMLSQVREITGLDTPTVQNWINRGWVGRPVDKRYSVDHLARIMLINMLRDVMQLENIAGLLTYINGKANVKDDDIIPESTLYIFLCEALDRLTFDGIMNPVTLDETVTDILSGYDAATPDAYVKLKNCLTVMTVYCAAAVMKRNGALLCKTILNE